MNAFGGSGGKDDLERINFGNQEATHEILKIFSIHEMRFIAFTYLTSAQCSHFGHMHCETHRTREIVRSVREMPHRSMGGA